MQRLIPILVKILAILGIDLSVTLGSDQITALQKYMSKPLVTLAGMLITVLLFYFLMTYIEQFVKWVLEKILNVGKQVQFRGIGLIVIIGILYLGMFYAYYFVYFKKWPTLATLGL